MRAELVIVQLPALGYSGIASSALVCPCSAPPLANVLAYCAVKVGLIGLFASHIKAGGISSLCSFFCSASLKVVVVLVRDIVLRGRRHSSLTLVHFPAVSVSAATS